MKTKSLLVGTKGLRTAVPIVGLMLAFVSRSEAGFKAIIDGITVSYSVDGANAYYDSTDGTLTVTVSQSGGSLKILIGPTAHLSWGDYVDIYISADDATLKSINIKGSLDCTPFVVGQVNHITKFSLLNGVVGNTDYYGQDFGLGMVSDSTPVSISLKNSASTAQLFGFAYTNASPLPLAGEQKLSAERLAETFTSPKSQVAATVPIDKRFLIQRLRATPR